MSQDYWQQQVEPLYPDILWSRPETKQGAGKLLIIGGNSFGFAAPAAAYGAAQAAGAGACKVLLPEALRKTVGSHLADAEFAPNNMSGSFSKSALDQMFIHGGWADAVVLAGELGRNSETAVTLEGYAKKFSGQLCVTRDAVDYFLETPSVLIDRPATLVVASFEQLQKLAQHTKHQEPLLFSMSNILLAEWLHDFSLLHQASFITLHNQHLFVAQSGKVVSQKTLTDEKIWRVATAARATVFWMQNPKQSFEAIATSFAKLTD